jgi:hypothetical protein
MYFLIGVFPSDILLALAKALILYLFAFGKGLCFYEARFIKTLSSAIIILIHFDYQYFVSNFLSFPGLF